MFQIPLRITQLATRSATGNSKCWWQLKVLMATHGRIVYIHTPSWYHCDRMGGRGAMFSKILPASLRGRGQCFVKYSLRARGAGGTIQTMPTISLKGAMGQGAIFLCRTEYNLRYDIMIYDIVFRNQCKTNANQCKPMQTNAINAHQSKIRVGVHWWCRIGRHPPPDWYVY